MPVNPVVPNVAEMRVHFSLPLGEEMLNVHNCDIGAATLDFTLANAIAGAYVAAWTAELQSSIADTVSIDGIVVTDLRTTTGPSFDLAYTVPGTETSQLLPGQVAAVVKWKTALRGRSYQGRTYLGGFGEDQSAGQSPSPTCLTAIQDFADALIGGLSTANADLSIVSRYEPNPSPPPGSIPRVTNIRTAVSSAQVDQAWHTHRSRALKG